MEASQTPQCGQVLQRRARRVPLGHPRIRGICLALSGRLGWEWGLWPLPLDLKYPELALRAQMLLCVLFI